MLPCPETRGRRVQIRFASRFPHAGHHGRECDCSHAMHPISGVLPGTSKLIAIIGDLLHLECQVARVACAGGFVGHVGDSLRREETSTRRVQGYLQDPHNAGNNGTFQDAT
ncbi:hypothetical protein PAHAL_4G110700 [Panicum hallii]|uniref:Uncharacterized protein n=1 Tax=Panicum hallii TaxID=206008 RepID=A0A2S3HIL0_9POAL|nr:hypothetical protein PAHAL_4G110700 [Panicum hallii]